MRSKAILAGILSCAAFVACAYAISRWLFPLEPAASLEELAWLEKAISFQSYLMLPILSAGIGLVCRLAGIRRCEVAGVLAVLPTVVIFISGNHGSLLSLVLAVAFLALAWITAKLAGGRLGEQSVPDPAPLFKSTLLPGSRRTLSVRKGSGRGNPGGHPA